MVFDASIVVGQSFLNSLSNLERGSRLFVHNIVRYGDISDHTNTLTAGKFSNLACSKQ